MVERGTRMKRSWYCTKCQKRRKLAIPSVGIVGYATNGRVWKCWKCRSEMYLILESVN